MTIKQIIQSNSKIIMLHQFFFNIRYHLYFLAVFFVIICFSNAFALETTAVQTETTTNIKEKIINSGVNLEKIATKEPKEESKNNENTNDSNVTNNIASNIDINQTEENNNPRNFANTATLQILNKNNSKTSVTAFNIGKKQKFEDLNIVVYKCWKSPEYQKPEAKILVEIFEIQKDQSNNFKKTTQPQKNQDKRIFYGWLFASSPSISSLEHSVYDVVAVSCK
jgi:hypothetical protein